MNSFPELTKEEIINVLLYGNKPQGGYTIQDSIDEWNERVKNGEHFQINKKIGGDLYG